MKTFFKAAAAAMFCFAASCTPPPASDDKAEGEEIPDTLLADTITLALDWSPNVLHSGIFLAEHRGWYRDAGIHLHWFTTEVDGYKKKPVQRLTDGEVDLAVGPSEHLFFYRKSEGVNPVAVASLLQADRSAFCVKSAEGISGPGDLAEHTYIGYDTPLEEAILTAVMHYDGLEKAPEMRTPGRLEVWEDFMKKQNGIAWIFRHWEGALAEHAGTALTCFDPADYGVPYGYSSVLMAAEKPDTVEAARLRKFLRVTERGYRAAAEMPADSLARLLQEATEHPNFSDLGFLTLAAESIRSAFLRDDGVWGVTDPARWESYLNWMREAAGHALPDSLHTADSYFTNRYLD